MKILAFDPGYDRLGVAFLEKKENGKVELLFSDCFLTDKKTKKEDRFLAIGNFVNKILKEKKPDLVAIENLFFSKNQKTVMTVAELRGILIYESKKNKVSVLELNPGTIKLSTTGYGKSNKKSVINMVQRLIKIDKKIKFDDEYDAIAIGLTAVFYKNN